ncbi:hypothetical protein [Phenylobacterium sp.]|uniref:hypothetical protein n=1 Tax=Phenylobacterium sp. TaxID=1871053 RepID=UPI002F3FFCB6
MNATLQWFAKRADRSGRLIAVCDPLGIAIEADSEDELRSLMEESTELLFKDLIEDDEFDQFLRDRGWTASNGHQIGTEEVNFRVPMELVLGASSRGTEHRPR